MALKEEQIAQILSLLEKESFYNISFEVYKNPSTRRIAIKSGGKVLGEINSSKGKIDLYLKAMTVIKTDGFKTEYDSFEYKESKGYDNPFIFRNVSDLAGCMHLIDSHALDITNEMISKSMEQRMEALTLIQK